jgi:hypothetical protein
MEGPYGNAYRPRHLGLKDDHPRCSKDVSPACAYYSDDHRDDPLHRCLCAMDEIYEHSFGNEICVDVWIF